MKNLIVILICTFQLPVLAQSGNDQRVILEKCIEGSDSNQITVSIETGGLTGTMIFARVDQGRFHSGDVIVRQYDGMAIPEDRTYLDVETNGKKFRLTYDFINKGQFGTLIYNNDLKNAPSTNKLICNSTL